MSEREVFVAVGASFDRVVEALDALKADNQEDVTDHVHLLVPDEPNSHEVAQRLLDTLSTDGWVGVRSTSVSLEALPDALVEILVGVPADLGTGSFVLLPSGGGDLGVALVVLAERAGIGFKRALPGDPEHLETVLDHDHFGEDGSPACTVALDDWLFFPHAARIHRLYRDCNWVNPEGAQGRAEPEDVNRTVDAMLRRTKKWVDGDVWQADLLPHMVHHGKRHGQRVDRLATDLLRISPLMGQMSPRERLSAVEALSAAAWLHDVGQQGGVLDDIYVREYSHVRQFHGLLTREIIRVGADEFDLHEPNLRFLVAQLSKCHQRNARLLRAEEPKRPGYCPEKAECPICEQAKIRLDAYSLADELAREDNPLVRDTSAVSLAAILRVADAADIGVHRVNGRWEAKTTAVEHVWRREFVYEQLLMYQSKLNDKALRALYRLLTREPWEQADLDTMKNALDEIGASDSAKKVHGFDKYLRDQRGHVDKHRLFAGSRIDATKDNSFTIELRAASGWKGAGAGERKERFREASAYIWGEYCHSEQYFEDPLLPRLRAVIDPAGTAVLRDEVS